VQAEVFSNERILADKITGLQYYLSCFLAAPFLLWYNVDLSFHLAFFVLDFYVFLSSTVDLYQEKKLN